MYYRAIIVVLFAAILESLIIIVGNIFTIFVFWKHRYRLKRTFFLLINLAVADLLVGFTELIALGPSDIAGHLEETSFNSAPKANISTAFQVTFSLASVFFLALISLERAYALIWPLRHRVWKPISIVVNSILYLCLNCVPLLFFQILNIFRWANSFVNPIICSLGIPMFRETFKRAKLCKQSNEYTINYTP